MSSAAYSQQQHDLDDFQEVDESQNADLLVKVSLLNEISDWQMIWLPLKQRPSEMTRQMSQKLLNIPKDSSESSESLLSSMPYRHLVETHYNM